MMYIATDKNGNEYNLAEDQLFNHFRGNFTTRQHFADDHFTQIYGRNAVIRRRLTGKWGT